MKLSLSRQQRKALFAGEHPRITIVPTVEPAPEERIPLSTKVELVVVGLEDPEGERVLLYVVADHRPRLLRAKAKNADWDYFKEHPEQYRGAVSEGEIARWAEASNYTASPGAALRGSGEEVSRADQERFKKESAAPAMQMLRQDRAELRAFVDRVRDNPLYQHGTGSIASELRFMERKGQKVLSKIEARINGEARRAEA